MYQGYEIKIMFGVGDKNTYIQGVMSEIFKDAQKRLKKLKNLKGSILVELRYDPGTVLASDFVPLDRPATVVVRSKKRSVKNVKTSFR